MVLYSFCICTYSIIPSEESRDDLAAGFKVLRVVKSLLAGSSHFENFNPSTI